MKKLTVHPVLSKYLNTLSAQEMRVLREQIIEDGCRDAIVVWANHDDTIIDGHHRYQICTENDIQFKTKPLRFDSIEEVKLWMLSNQEGRRNMTKEAIKYMQGKEYNRRKGVHGGDRKSNDQIDHLKDSAATVAAQYKVGPATIRRNAKFAEVLDDLEPKQRLAILTGGKDHLPESEPMSQKQQILARLKEGPAELSELKKISCHASARIGEMRRDSEKNIQKEGSLYTLLSGKYSENGKKKKKKKGGKFQIKLESRFDLPYDQAGAIKRVREIASECDSIFKKSKNHIDVAYNRFRRLTSELNELMRVFDAAK